MLTAEVEALPVLTQHTNSFVTQKDEQECSEEAGCGVEGRDRKLKTWEELSLAV